MADKKLSEFEAMGYDNSTPVMIPAVRYSSSEAGATKENRNIPLNLFYQPSFLKYEWSDCLRNEACWLRADTFSWHSGDSQYANSYEQVYNHLVDDIDGKSLTSETIAGITIEYYLADDMHKICPASQEENLISLYNTVGIAWYYIIDTTNTRFKLPRTKFGFTGLRDDVGKYVPETLPNIRGQVRGWLHYRGGSDTGALYADNNLEETVTGHNNYTSTWARHPTLDASRSSSTYQDNAPVQQRATQMYLYCYVGKFSNSAIVNIAGEHTELFNDKVDLSSSWGFPTSTYDDLTLGASGSTYTAPADGFFMVACTGTAGSTYFELVGHVSSTASFTGGWARASIPVKKGETITVYYAGTNFTKQKFQFIYAQKSN